MSDEVKVKDAKPENAPADIAKQIVDRMADFEKAMKEERAAAEAKVAQQIEEINARVAAAKAFHVNEQKEQAVSPARIIAAAMKVREGLSDPWKGAEYEREVIEQHAHERVMSVGADTAGGYWVPEQYLADQFVENLRAATVIYTLGATELTGLTGSPVVIPKKTSSSTAYWVAENAAITASDLGAGQINLEPHACAALVKMSNRLRMLANPSVEAMVNADMARSIGLKIEYAALRGPTIAGEPTGITLTASINTTTTASINVTNASSMLYQLEVDNAATGALGFAMNPRVFNTIRGRYRTKHAEFGGGIMTTGPGAPFRYELIGFPVAISTQIRADASSTSDVYFGNWNDLVVARWGGIEFAVSTEADTAFAANQFWVRAIAEVDVGVRQAESFCVNSSVTD